MTVPSRGSVISHLATKITAGITDLQAVYDHDPKDIGGQSPLCIITRGPLQYTLPTDNEFQSMKVAVGFWVRMDGDATPLTREAAEEKLDSLAVSLATVLDNYYRARFYQASEFLEAEMVDGTVYTVEIHFVEIDWRTGYTP